MTIHVFFGKVSSTRSPVAIFIIHSCHRYVVRVMNAIFLYPFLHFVGPIVSPSLSKWVPDPLITSSFSPHYSNGILNIYPKDQMRLNEIKTCARKLEMIFSSSAIFKWPIFIVYNYLAPCTDKWCLWQICGQLVQYLLNFSLCAHYFLVKGDFLLQP